MKRICKEILERQSRKPFSGDFLKFWLYNWIIYILYVLFLSFSINLIPGLQFAFCLYILVGKMKMIKMMYAYLNRC